MPTTPNTLPNAPSNPGPENGARDVLITPILTWEASDPDGETLTYDLYFGTEETNLIVEASDLTVSSYEFTEPLENETTYYWKVAAKDGKGETLSEVWSFTTESEPATDFWQKTYGGIYVESARSIQQTEDGEYIVAGTTNSFGAGYDDVYVIKLGSDGNEEWHKTYGGSYADFAYSIQQTTDEGYIVAGHTRSLGEGENDVYVIKLGSDGNEEWHKAYGGSLDDFAYSIQLTTDRKSVV